MLPAGGSCLLGSINLSEFVVNKQFDMDEFIKTVKICVRALNDVLDEGLELHPLYEQRKSVTDWRQIGLGVMGIADMLIKLHIKYGSPESLSLCSDIAEHMINTATLESCSLAANNGMYPKCKPEKILECEFFKNYAGEFLKDAVTLYGLRNSQLLTIAPTGTLSTMLGISGGIEPIFANYYTRKTESLHGEDVYYKVYTPIVLKYIDKLTQENAELDIDNIVLPEWFVTASDIDYVDRIKMQSVWLEYIDASISSTVNLPNETTVDDVFNLYIDAWKYGLKGITIFRDGCARVGVLTTSDSVEESSDLKRGEIIPSSDNLIGLKKKLITGCGSLHCTAYFDPECGELREVYLSKGSTGGCNNFMVGLSRMISLSARGGVSIDNIIDLLLSTGTCPSYASRSAVKRDTSRGSCCPVAIGYALKEMSDEFSMMINSNSIKPPEKTEINRMNRCPICDSELTFEGGCNICKNCGWSKCD